MTTRLRSASTSKGFPVNYCSGFLSVGTETACKEDGVSHQSFRLEVNAMDYGFEPTDTPRTDRSVNFEITFLYNLDHDLACPFVSCL
ncbi:Sucrase-isomaltase, intestinal [Gossypium arboreum]|uniref:Sucrase-isomaltase, intestinal n=1 Tax=Gossypium arboreum TaxID=29729 RepID=A0A0B0PQ46_GOSAR|nr:Sucrase-isomaltase, intestinal [Gossypium arboreum]